VQISTIVIAKRCDGSLVATDRQRTGPNFDLPAGVARSSQRGLLKPNLAVSLNGRSFAVGNKSAATHSRVSTLQPGLVAARFDLIAVREFRIAVL